MFCEKCGKKRIEGARFCDNCGTPFEIEENKDRSESSSTIESKENLSGEFKPKETKNIQKETNKVVEITTGAKPDKKEVHQKNDPVNKINNKANTKQEDKKTNIKEKTKDWNWMYEFSFWRNPAILITTAKVLILGLLAPVLLLFIFTLTDGDGLLKALQVSGSIFGYGLIVIAVLLALAYPLVALLQGGSYLVLFKMDDQGIDHIQLNSQVKKAQAVGYLTALAGVATGNLSVAGAGLLSASRRNLYTSFKKVQSVKAVRSRNTIYVNELLNKNQVYPEPGEFDQVLDYIIRHCPKDVHVSGR